MFCSNLTHARSLSLGVARMVARSGSVLAVRVYCTVLYCAVLCCTVLYCTVVSTHHNYNTTQEVAGTGFVANYLPLISVNFIAVAYQFGLGPVGWSYTGQ